MLKPRQILTDRTYVPRDDSYSRNRNEEILTRHRVRERAIEAGRKNEPATEDTQLDECQRDLVGESYAFIATTSRMAGEEVTESTNSARHHKPSPVEPVLAIAITQRAAAEATERYTADLDLAHVAARRAQRDLRGFEEVNRLEPYSAVYKNDVAMFISSLVAIAIAESGLNAFLFSELQDQGLFGGMLLALTVSIANIVLGLGMGFLGLRLIVHVKPTLRLLGTAFTTLFGVAALAMHLALGNLRETISHHSGAQIDFLIITKPWSWFDYTSPAPFVLVVVGLAAFAVVTLKARGGSWGVVAPYWGHEGVDRRYRQAQAALQDAEDNLKDALANAFDGERAKLMAAHAEDTRHVAEMRRLSAEAHSVARTLDDSIKGELARLHLWLQTYRDGNRRVRTTPAPAYFKQYPMFEEWTASRLDLTEINGLVAEAEQILAMNSRELSALQDLILSEHVATIKRLTASVDESRERAGRRITDDDASF